MTELVKRRALGLEGLMGLSLTSNLSAGYQRIWIMRIGMWMERSQHGKMQPRIGLDAVGLAEVRGK